MRHQKCGGNVDVVAGPPPTEGTVATGEMSFDMAIQKDLIWALDVASGVQAQKRRLNGPEMFSRKTISEPARYDQLKKSSYEFPTMSSSLGIR